jgi:hypothetical protein
MNDLLVGYARASTEQQDLTVQRNGLHALGVGDDRIYVDHGLTGTNRDRPGCVRPHRCSHNPFVPHCQTRVGQDGGDAILLGTGPRPRGRLLEAPDSHHWGY